MPDLLTNRYTIAYGAALLLHVLLLALLGSPRNAALAPVSPQPVAAEPIQFEFVDAPDRSAAEERPEDTRFVSTRDAVSRDASDADLPATDTPYSEGIVASGDAFETRPEVRPSPGQAGSPGEAGQAERRDPEDAAEAPQTDFAALLRRPAEADGGSAQGAFGRPVVPPSLQLKNLTSRALERGGLELSTYEWDYAPYLAYLKDRIGGNLFPPALFKDYGLIDGQTRLRFRIYRDGTLRGPNVLNYVGSPLLRETSVRAVELSAAFKPLPKDFPDDYLEVTGLFDYVIIRDHR